jgi:HAD superfamily hydrolase (TIGR01509 family)
MCLDGYAVLWDMDGTLVDSGALHRRAWRLFLSQQGQPVSDEILEQGVGRPNEQVLPTYWGHELSEDELRRLSDEKEQCYRDLVRAEGLASPPGVMAWLARFQEAGLRQALATSGCRANADLIADLTGTRPYFAVIVASEDVARGKPHPDVFLHTARLLDAPPARCLVIEDSTHGIAAARAAGMRCLAIATTHGIDVIQDADLALESMRDFTWALWQRIFDGS